MVTLCDPIKVCLLDVVDFRGKACIVVERKPKRGPWVREVRLKTSSGRVLAAWVPVSKLSRIRGGR